MLSIESSRFLDENAVAVPDSGCWLWTKSITNCGYGKTQVGEKTVSAHRRSFELAFGEIPKGLFVCHSCDVRLCVNPNHLFLGTQRDNIRDALKKSRMSSGQKHRESLAGKAARGERQGNSKLTESDILAIRSDNRTIVAIGRDYGISHPYVSKIKLRKTWTHIA